MQANAVVVVDDITSAVVNGVNSNCDQQTSCFLDEGSISSAETLCVFGNRPLYRASLASSGSGCNDRLLSLMQWVESDAARIIVDGEELVIASDCSVGVESFLEPPGCNDPDMTTDVTTSDITSLSPDTTTVNVVIDNSERIIIGASTGAAGLLILIAVVILIVLGANALIAAKCSKRKK